MAAHARSGPSACRRCHVERALERGARDAVQALEALLVEAVAALRPRAGARAAGRRRASRRRARSARRGAPRARCAHARRLRRRSPRGEHRPRRGLVGGVEEHRALAGMAALELADHRVAAPTSRNASPSWSSESTRASWRSTEREIAAAVDLALDRAVLARLARDDAGVAAPPSSAKASRIAPSNGGGRPSLGPKPNSAAARSENGPRGSIVQRSRSRRARRGELAAGGVDVAPARQAHGHAHAARLERGAEGGDRVAPRAGVGGVGRVVGDQVDLEGVARREQRRRARAPARSGR